MTDAIPTSDPAVTLALDGEVATITIDDGKANALGHGIIAAVHEGLDRAEKEARAVAIIGRPGRFSAGFDLKVMTSGSQQARDLLSAGGELAVRCYELSIPTVFGCTGHTLAMGAIWLLAADVRIGAEGDFKLGMNEVAIGMPVPRFAVEFGRDRLSKRHFPAAVGLARIYDPAGAVDAGYLDRVVPPDDLVAEVRAEATALTALKAGAFVATRANSRGEVGQRLRAGKAADLEEFAILDT